MVLIILGVMISNGAHLFLIAGNAPSMKNWVRFHGDSSILW